MDFAKQINNPKPIGLTFLQLSNLLTKKRNVKHILLKFERCK
jgi:hypothetical protein